MVSSELSGMCGWYFVIVRHGNGGYLLVVLALVSVLVVSDSE